MNAAIAIAITLGACVFQPGAVAAEPASPPSPAVRPSDEAIQQAIREVLDEHPESPRQYDADILRGNRYDEFAREFSDARVPDCLHPDALKRQPPTIGPIGFQGLYAVPFVVLAKIRGKCH